MPTLDDYEQRDFDYETGDWTPVHNLDSMTHTEYRHVVRELGLSNNSYAGGR